MTKRLLTWRAASVLTLLALGLTPSATAGVIGERLAGGMKIEAVLEEAQTMQMLMAGEWMTEKPAKGATHHFEVALIDPKYGGRIPYATVSATFVNLATKATFATRLEAMYGDELHYGTNVKLAKGRYSVALRVKPPALMREGESLDRWLAPVKTRFTFTVR